MIVPWIINKVISYQNNGKQIKINYNLYMEKIIEVNLGVGMNQLFPETTKIVIEVEDEEECVCFVSTFFTYNAESALSNAFSPSIIYECANNVRWK